MAPKPAPKPAPETTPELLARLRESPSYPSMAAEALVQAFDDRKSWRGFHALTQKAWEGEVEPSALVKAWERATDGKARNPAAVFMTVAMRDGKGGGSW